MITAMTGGNVMVMTTVQVDQPKGTGRRCC